MTIDNKVADAKRGLLSLGQSFPTKEGDQPDDPEDCECPMPLRGEEPKISNGNITIHYLDSFRRASVYTDKVMTPEQIVAAVKARAERFDRFAENPRESDSARTLRKFMSAHPVEVLRSAWDMADGEIRDEMDEMFNPASHYGNSSPDWVKANAKAQTVMMGDDGRPL